MDRVKVAHAVRNSAVPQGDLHSLLDVGRTAWFQDRYEPVVDSGVARTALPFPPPLWVVLFLTSAILSLAVSANYGVSGASKMAF